MKGKKVHEDRSCRASGGPVEEGSNPSTGAKKITSYTNTPNNVVSSAEETVSKFKKGGRVKKKESGAEGAKAMARMDRAPRKARASGGPLSTAANTSERPGGKVTSVG